MEEDKAEAYYNELLRKGTGAARYKQGLGFGSNVDEVETHKSESGQFTAEHIREKLRRNKKEKSYTPLENEKRNNNRNGVFCGSKSRSVVVANPEKRNKKDTRPSSSENEIEGKIGNSEASIPLGKRTSSIERGSQFEKRQKAETMNGRHMAQLFQTPAERVREKMRQQLSEITTRDERKGKNWERFEFDNCAPLDSDANLSYFGDGTGAIDDSVFLQNSGSTFGSSQAQVTRESHVKELHEKAIFGAPNASGRNDVEKEKKELPEHSAEILRVLAEDGDDSPIVVPTRMTQNKNDSQKPSSNISWQERVRRRREEKGKL